MKEKILKALNWRYAVKIFNKEKKLSNEDLETILEAGRLSPSSSGFEPWKFILVNDPVIRAKLFEVSKQPKVTDASHLIVLAYKTNPAQLIEERLARTAKIQNQKPEELEKYKQYLEKSLQVKIEDGSFESWVKAQTYIPLGIMVETASLLDIDAGPMEGFENVKVDEILGLREKNLKSVTMLALGYRGEDPASLKPKIRRDFNDAIEII